MMNDPEKDMDPCIICIHEQAETIPPRGDYIHQTCPRCGEFKVSGTAQSMMSRALGDAKRSRLSEWVGEQNRKGDVPLITSDTLDEILSGATRRLPTETHRPSRGPVLSALTIENFKGIREPVRIAFAPVTLLFGPNNAGKSTVVQALHYAREIFERGNADPGRTLLGGDVLDLGGFDSLVHNHDRSLPIRMRFELDLSHEELPEFSARFELGREATEMDGVPHLESATVEIQVKWSPWKSAPVVSRYAISLNGDGFADLILTEDKKQISLKFSGAEHPFLAEFQPGFSDYRPVGQDETEFTLIDRFASALPSWGEFLPIEPENWLVFGTTDQTDRLKFMTLFAIHMSRLIVGPGMILKDVLQRFRYLSPFREMPGRNHHPARSPDEFRWSNGMAAWDLLLLKGETLVEKVNAWLTHEERLNAGYRVEVKRYKELEVNGPLMMALTGETVLDDEEWIRDAVRSLPERRQLLIRDQRRDVELFPQDVGVGISQVVPVLVAALHSQMGIVAIEEPESNIHPAFQVALGDLFISQTREKPDLMFLVETHSEHLMLRFLRRIRETGENELPPGAPSLTPEGIAVYFVEPEEDGPRIHRIRIDRDGDFIDRWPRGFFQERMKELYGS